MLRWKELETTQKRSAMLRIGYISGKHVMLEERLWLTQEEDNTPLYLVELS